MIKISRSFSSHDVPVKIGSQYWQALTALMADSFVFLKFGRIGQPHPSTPRLSCFLPILKFLKKHK